MIYETVHLREIAYARSGDKGVHANVGVIAYTPQGYDYLKEHLTEDKVKAYFQLQDVIRYELSNLQALNFLLKGALSDPLRIDVQGKALGQQLLEMEIQVPETLLCRCKRGCNQ